MARARGPVRPAQWPSPSQSLCPTICGYLTTYGSRRTACSAVTERCPGHNKVPPSSCATHLLGSFKQPKSNGEVLLMAVTLVNPSGLPEIPIYRQVSIATGSKLVHVAGQVAWDSEGHTIGVGDLAAQVEQCYLNVGAALAGVGATFADVVKITMHVVDWAPQQMPLLLQGIEGAAAKLGVAVSAPASLFGIVALDVPEHLVEVEAVAVLD